MKEIKKYLGIQQRLWLNQLLGKSYISDHYKVTITNVLTKDWYNKDEQYLLNVLRDAYGKSN